MADARGFLRHAREETAYRSVEDRVQDWDLVQDHFHPEKTQAQASRCMDCGLPFCNNGCPLGNVIPDFNDLVYRDKWQDALARLHLMLFDILAKHVRARDDRLRPLQPFFSSSLAFQGLR